MAAIVPMQVQQQQQQPFPGAAPTQTQDPLFEALVKYITSGPGPSSTSQAQIQAIIDSHVNETGGREYLESIVRPDVRSGQLKMWKNHANINSGFASTNMTQMTIWFTCQRNMIMQQLEFKGTCPGFFPPQVFQFPRSATFYWDDLTDNMPVTITARYLADVFFGNDGQPVGELLVGDAALRMPGYDIRGTGRFQLPTNPQ